MSEIGSIGELWRYPVSSMGGERLEAAEIGHGGVAGDRIWGVVDTRNGTVAGPEQRRHWRPLPDIHSRLGENRPQVRAGDGGWPDAGTDAARKLVSETLDLPAELRPHTPFETEKPGHVAPRYARADLHIVTRASMRRLAALLGDAREIDSRRFRPNLVIETPDDLEGFVEQDYVGRTFVIGELEVAVEEPCARCAFTSLAQGDLRFEPAVLHRIAEQGGGFGVLCKVTQPGRVRLGDAVRLA